jgi:hypothetical protein
MTDHIAVPYSPKRTFTIVVGIGLALLIGIIAVRVTQSNPSTPDLPTGIIQLFPPRDLVVRAQEQIGVHLNSDYTGELTLDGTPLPLDEYEVRGIEIGFIFWRPGFNQTFEELEPGPHTISLHYWPKKEGQGGENDRTFSWTFKSA